MVFTLFPPSLHELELNFGLQPTENEQFFREWIDINSEVSAQDKQLLDRVKVSYSHLIKYPPMLEDAVKMIVLSPLLERASLFQPPCRLETEPSIEIVSEDEGVIIKGRIDVLVLNHQFWILVIESKKAEFSLEAARAQILAYMLGSPNHQEPVFGLIANGGSFIFVKLSRESNTPQYALSRVFSLLNPGNDLYHVLGFLKRLSTLVQFGGN